MRVVSNSGAIWSRWTIINPLALAVANVPVNLPLTLGSSSEWGVVGLEMMMIVLSSLLLVIIII